MKTHPYDQIDHRLILALRAGHEAEISATLAHYTLGGSREYHLGKALEAADKVTAAAEALRAEIASLELEASMEEAS